MEIVKFIDGEKTILKISGRIDTTTSNQLQKEIDSLDDQNLYLVLDFLDTLYITSAGLRVLLLTTKKLKDKFEIINVNDEIESIFKTSSFDTLLKYSKTTSNNSKKSIKALLSKRVEENNKSIFSYRGIDYTWNDIEIASQIIAKDLNSLGVKKGSHVGIMSENSINWIFTFFAISKLGAIAELLNNKLKIDELINMAKIGDIDTLCISLPKNVDFNEYKNKILNSSKEIKEVYNISNEINYLDRKNEYPEILHLFREDYNADDPSIVIFTSGSSGTPKAVLSSSYNMFEGVKPIVTEYKIVDNDSNCAFLPFFHVFGFTGCISLALLYNVHSYIPDSIKMNDILNCIDTNKCTIMFCVPTILLGIISSPTFTLEKVSSLRLTVFGGAPMPKEQLLSVMKLMPNNNFVNIYGMSENCAISITKYQDTIEHIASTAGKPVSSTKVLIKDVNSDETLTTNKVGEICIKSDMMIVCYYNLPLQQQPIDETGWLRTGDLGFLDQDGYLTITGRKKELIIKGGENISPNEIVNVLSTINEIDQIKVIGIKDDYFGEDIAAAITLKPNCSFDENKVREDLSKKITKFKIPKYFIVLDQMPLLGSGKIDGVKIKEIIENTIK